MSEYLHVEKPFLDQLASLGWTVIDQGTGLPSSPAPSLRNHWREWILPEVFRSSVRAINQTEDGQEWLTDGQLEDLKDQLLRHPNRNLLEANTPGGQPVKREHVSLRGSDSDTQF